MPENMRRWTYVRLCAPVGVDLTAEQRFQMLLHRQLDGAPFPAGVGVEVNGRYLLPGSEPHCHCIDGPVAASEVN